MFDPTILPPCEEQCFVEATTVAFPTCAPEAVFSLTASGEGTFSRYAFKPSENQWCEKRKCL